MPESSYTFAHDGRPRVKERPRAGLHGRKLYTPKATLDAQAELAASYDGPMYDGPIEIAMTFCPQWTMVTIIPWADAVSSLRGDVDNYAKLVMDGLEGIAYPNDRQVMGMWARKVA